jgi:hypothetical protein
VVRGLVELAAKHGDPLVSGGGDDHPSSSFTLLWRAAWGRVGDILGGDHLTDAQRRDRKFWLGLGGLPHPGVVRVPDPATSYGTSSTDPYSHDRTHSRADTEPLFETAAEQAAEQELDLAFLGAGGWQPTWHELASLEIFYHAHERRRHVLAVFRDAARANGQGQELLHRVIGPRLGPDPAAACFRAASTFFDNLAHETPTPEFGRMFRDCFYKEVPTPPAARLRNCP